MGARERRHGGTHRWVVRVFWPLDWRVLILLPLSLSPAAGAFHMCAASFACAAGIPTDHVLPDNPTCRPFIEEYAADQQLFFRDFAAAFAKMTELGARWA